MPNLSSLTTNFFPTPNEGFTTTTSSTIDSSSATTIPLNSVSGLTNGAILTGLIDPGNAKERAFTGVVDTGGSQVTSVVFTTGSNATHTAGATIVDYVTGTHIGQIVKGILQSLNQDGTVKNGVITNNTLSTATGELGGVAATWVPTLTGYSAAPTNTSYSYFRIGKWVNLKISEGTSGTSNATTKTYTLPFTAATRTNAIWHGTAQIIDNGATVGTAVRATISSAATTMSVFASFASGNWTASGGARVVTLDIWYEAA